jgi:hypothetical protein
MQPESLAAWIIALVALCFALLRLVRGQVFVPIADGGVAGATRLPDDDEQQPETDRAPAGPRRVSSLALAVAATAALRLCLLAALHR